METLKNLAQSMIEVQNNNSPIAREKLLVTIQYCLGQDYDYVRLALILDECLKQADLKQEIENSASG